MNRYLLQIAIYLATAFSGIVIILLSHGAYLLWVSSPIQLVGIVVALFGLAALCSQEVLNQRVMLRITEDMKLEQLRSHLKYLHNADSEEDWAVLRREIERVLQVENHQRAGVEQARLVLARGLADLQLEFVREAKSGQRWHAWLTSIKAFVGSLYYYVLRFVAVLI